MVKEDLLEIKDIFIKWYKNKYNTDFKLVLSSDILECVILMFLHDNNIGIAPVRDEYIVYCINVPKDKSKINDLLFEVKEKLIIDIVVSLEEAIKTGLNYINHIK